MNKNVQPPGESAPSNFEGRLNWVDSKVSVLIEQFTAHARTADLKGNGLIIVFSPSQERSVELTDLGSLFRDDAIARQAMSQPCTRVNETTLRIGQNDFSDKDFRTAWSTGSDGVFSETFWAQWDKEKALDNMAKFFNAHDIEYIDPLSTAFIS